MPPPKKAYGDYSVGWICALPKEQTAATAMLDEKHETLPKLTNDANTYTLGSIGPHNVVIACLPKGQYGTNSAANVAAFMIRTFPSIKIGLMVGIGGGVPPRVRLGDVVISTPTGQYPGVVQWDLGKETEGGGFERTGALSNPPGSLLTALTKLETDYELAGSKIPGFLEELKAKFPRLAKKYMKSDKLQDLLFRADYVHIHEPFSNMNTEGPTGGIIEVSVEEDFEDGSDEDGDPCQFCDKSKLIKRRRRSIRVHHGLIASGNKVIKDGLRREKLNGALGGEVLCFETEAAGLMNNFPCLVIRGICDYCDSHKNNAWQEHAAAVAAAFAKELLGCIQPGDFEGERPIRDVMSEMKQDVQRLYDVSVETKKHLDTFRDDKEAKKRIETLNWLSPLDFPLIQHDYFARCERDTGQEFLLSEDVQSWISTKKQTLFCEGVPGAGKTFQMAILVNYLMEKFRYDGSVGVAYIYYNFKRHNDQKAEHMLASLVKQLAQNSRTFPEAVQKLHDRHSHVNTRPFLVELSDTLAVLVQSYSRVFLLIDALDEAEDTERTKFLDQILLMQENDGLNLFATSRAINTIAAKFEGSISKEISPSRHDVFQVLNARMSELPSFVREDEGLQNEIKASIEAAMGGMFLLAQLYLNSFVGSRSLASLKKSLASMQQASSSSSSSSSSRRSSVLDEAYDKSMERIQQLKGDLPRDAVLIIAWIVKAKRQMKVAELQEALAVEIGASELERDNIPTVDHIIQACASLVVVEGDGIELVHYTAQEYFERPGNRWMQNTHTYIANVCLTYLSRSDFRNGPWMSREDLAKKGDNCPFYSYSGANWVYHTNKAFEEGMEVSKVIGFLEGGGTQSSWYHNLMRSYSHDFERFIGESAPLEPFQSTLLHVAAFFGLYEVIASLLAQGLSPNVKDSNSSLPIVWAAAGGNARVTRFLLAATDKTIAGIGPWPLLLAAIMGHAAAVEALLEEYPVESREDGMTALGLAVEFEKKAVFDLLIEKGANVEARQTIRRRTPLAQAASKGCTAAVQWLVEKGANIEAKDWENRTPLMLAILENHEDIVQYLLGEGADIEAEDTVGQTPQLIAMTRKNDHFYQTLIEKGRDVTIANDRNQALFARALREQLNSATDFFLRNGFDINMTTKDKYTPLTLAINNGAGDAVEWLVEKGADLDKADGHDKTPLLTAIGKGDKRAVQFLIEKGSGLEFRVPGEDLCPSQPSPLVFAAGEGRRDIVELLLDKGADLEARADCWDGTALICASRRGHADVMQLLLQKGADIEAEDRWKNRALIEASNNGRKNAIELLLLHNANLEARGWHCFTALGSAVWWNQPDAVRILLDSGADVEAKDSGGVPPIAHAVRRGHALILTMLLESKAEIDYRNHSGESLMHIAVANKRLECVRVLLACDTVEVDGKDNKGRTPLSHAAERGPPCILKALLESDKTDVNLKDDQGLTPLRYAIYRQDEDGSVLRELLSSEKVDVHAKDGQGRTPLICAIESKNESTVRMLLECERVDANETDQHGRRPIQYAIQPKYEDGSILSKLLSPHKTHDGAVYDEACTPPTCAAEWLVSATMRLFSENSNANSKDDRGRTSFRYAMDQREQDGSILKVLLRSGKVDVNAKDTQGRTPLCYAAKCRDKMAIDALLEIDEVDAQAEDILGHTALFYALLQGPESVMGRESGSVSRRVYGFEDDALSDVSGLSDEFELYDEPTPLLSETQIEDASILTKLLDSGKADVNGVSGGCRLLKWSMIFKHKTMVETLLKSGKVDLNLKVDDQRTPLQYATSSELDSILEVLLDHASVEGVNAQDDEGRTILRYAIELGRMSVVERLLKCDKTDLNANDAQGRTPLRYAVEYRNDAIIRLLLASSIPYTKRPSNNAALASSVFSSRRLSDRIPRTVDADAVDKEGRTPLLYAVQSSDEPTSQLLLGSGKVDANLGDNKGRTPLSSAINLRSIDIVEALLNYHDIDPNTVDDEGRTPVSCAIQNRDEHITQLLLGCGKVNVNIADEKGRTPLSHAMEFTDKYIVRALLDYPDIDLDTKDGEGRTPLSYAASHEVARVLLKTGKVDVNSKDHQGRTPLWYAMNAGNQALEGLLRRRGAMDRTLLTRETRSRHPSSQRPQGKGSTSGRTDRRTDRRTEM